MAGLGRSTVAFTLLAGLLAVSAPALAHADLMGAEPQPNTRIDEAPDRLVLDFSEPLEDRYTRVQLLDGNGTDHVETFTIPADDRQRLVAEVADVPDGVHTVEWRALSSADGHTTSGSYLLAVNASLTGTDTPTSTGDASSPGPAGADEGQAQVEEGGPAEATVRALGFLGASLAVGIPLFRLTARDVNVVPAVRRRWALAAIAGAGLAAAAALGVAATLAARTGLGLQAAFGTTPGQNALLRGGLFAAAGLLLAAGRRWRDREHGPALEAGGALAAAAGLLATSLGSHAAADGVGTGLAITVDWIHQAAVGFWIAGVLALALASLSDTSARSAARLIRRFSPLAVASVALIVVTGAIASLDRLHSLADLVDGLYGFALSAKILLLVPLIALGAYHRYRLLPRLEDDPSSLEAGLLRRSTVLELGVMVLVLAAAGLMTTASPPTPPAQQAPYASFQAATAADTPGPYQPMLADSELASLDVDEAENLTLTLLTPDRVDELATGPRPVWVLLTDDRGSQPRAITDAEVEIQAWMPAMGHGTSPETDPVHVHEGMYEGATNLVMDGKWRLRFNVTLPEGDVLRYAATVYVGEEADPLDSREPLQTVEEDGHRLEVFLSPQPVRVGVQNLTVRVTPIEGAMADNADVVGNLEAPSSAGGEGRSLDLERWRPDAWTREDAIFTEEGTWSLTLALQGRGTYVQTDLAVEVAGR